MGEDENILLGKMRDKIVRAVNPRQIILFGSRARENSTADSNIDLLIVERQPFGKNRSRWAELKKIRRALSGFQVPKDILVYSLNEVNQWRNSLNHVIGVALREGKVLFERPRTGKL